MKALGRLFDIGQGWAPVDLNTADGATGLRIALSGANAITFVCTFGAAAGGTDNIVLDVQQHTAYTGGTTKDLDSADVASSTGITEFWVKSEATLDNDEAWTRITQAEASECTLTGATYAQVQKIVVIEIDGAQLGDGYTHVSLNCSVAALANAELAACLYFPHDLRYQRKAVNLPNLLRPNAANA